MSNKIKELKEAIEKSNIGYVSLIADEDGSTIDDKNIFNSVEEVLNYID